ncbi:hypothetical protein pEaSNUABM56_00187 [Erwinia phage pEa_SNUABM_56]|uniref:Uncharacterized protein n=1 Tax=Erwinia phage pEp_SNUABM_01 TaxID=2601643 RepID=A0A5J6DBE3_9CAUD|nr:hypothetical protein HWC63_gp215 [Erwinia phage pEp_SNUABM_01]QEQ94963.1 hypothetical protein pEpSNUABM01_137 [Erwinia phage pEp_SNUABM_01]UYL84888.1 hypothetical protein pEaSNUABM55_00115 [Erwinia phage pEa_SNUABM_55]UYL85207.1 hypothetical protein pEaSNUABM56_00187 [Erwinia phage pEa_SNUABM_56]
MSAKQVTLNDPIPMTRGQLITIIEDAFVDGWKKGHWSEWGSAESFLEFYKEEGDSCETTTALEGLKSGETDVD